MEHNGAWLCHAGRRRDLLARRALYLGRGSFIFSGLRTTWGIQSEDDSMSENPKMSARTMLLRCLHARVTKTTQGFNECNNWMSRLLPVVPLITRVPY